MLKPVGLRIKKGRMHICVDGETFKWPCPAGCAHPDTIEVQQESVK
jgi:hypothetical protein